MILTRSISKRMGNISSSAERNSGREDHSSSRYSDADSSSMSSSADDNSARPDSYVRHSRSRSEAAVRRGNVHRRRDEEMSYFQMARKGYNELVNAIIRPPRARYNQVALGPNKFRFHGKVFKRTDFLLENSRGMTLQCSHWEPDGWRYSEKLPCVVYLHGNSSARPEALPQLEIVLSLGATLFCFDCSGSGLSDGDYVSLGYWERDDLEAVINYLRASGDAGPIALWGRSMGAATALLHGDRDPGIAAMVLDSAFTDLTQLAQEMVQKGRDAGLLLPGLAVKLALRMIRSSVQKAAGFNLKDLCPIKHATQTFIPALFIAASGDTFIQPHHTQELYNVYAGDKNMIIVDGDHNSTRPQFLHDSVFIFLQNCLRIPVEWSLFGSDVDQKGPAGIKMVAEGQRNGDWDIDSNFLHSLRNSSLDNESQLHVQQALFQMLAQEKIDKEAAATAATATNSVAENGKINGIIQRPSDEMTRTANDPLNMSVHSSNNTAARLRKDSTKTVRNEELDGSASTIHSGFAGVEIIEDYSGSNNAEKMKRPPRPNSLVFFGASWICNSCTLINEGYTNSCSVCGNVRDECATV